MNVEGPVYTPLFWFLAIICGSGPLALLGWLFLLALIVLGVLLRFKVLPMTLNLFCGLAHIEVLFFLLITGINGFIMSCNCICSGPPDFHLLMLAFGQVLIAQAINLVLVSVLLVTVKYGNGEKLVVMPGTLFQGAILVTDTALLLSMQMMVFARME